MCLDDGRLGDQNYYGDGTQCPAGLTGPRWRAVVESENAPGASCPGPANRSYQINGSGSPVILGWLSHTSDLGPNWTVHLKVDQVTYPSCGDGYFTYLGFQDEAQLDPGPLPDFSQLVRIHTFSYNQYVANGNSSARLLAGAQVYWNGKAHILEVDLASANWPAAPGAPAGTILVSSDTGGNEYVVLDGPAWGLAVPADLASHDLSIPWKYLFTQAAMRGWFSPVPAERATQSVYVAIETKNQAISDLYHTNFRILSAP